MLTEHMFVDELDRSSRDITREQALQRAAQYRWTAEYIERNDAALSRYLRQKADECEMVAIAKEARGPAYAQI